jgi:hypothetical protein
MTYYQLVKALEDLAYEAGAASYWTGAKMKNGINYDADFPMAEFFDTQPSQVLLNAVVYNIAMGFYGKDEHENGGEQTLQIQSEMDSLTQRFIGLLRESEDFQLQADSVSRMPTTRNGTKIGTGYFIDFNLVLPLVC